MHCETQASDEPPSADRRTLAESASYLVILEYARVCPF